MMTQVPQIQFIDESRRQRGQQTQRDVYTPGRQPKEECADKQSSQTVSQPASTVGRAPEEPSHQQDDQAVVRSSGGERDRVKSHMSEDPGVRAQPKREHTTSSQSVEPFTNVKGDIDKHVSISISKLLVENKCDPTSQGGVVHR